MTTRRLLLRAAALAATALLVTGCSSDSVNAPEVIPLEEQTWATSLGINLAAMTKLPSGVYILDVVPGTGAEANANSTVSVNYTLWLANGTQVQSNMGGAPFRSPLSGLIRGWQEGIPGMRVGGTRRLVIPSNLGYGPGGNSGIPGNANLVFDVILQQL